MGIPVPGFLEQKRKGEEELAKFVGEKLEPIIKPLAKQVEKIPVELRPEVRSFLGNLLGKAIDFLPEVDVTDFFDPSMGAIGTVKRSVKATRRVAMAKKLAEQSAEVSADVGEKFIPRMSQAEQAARLSGDPEMIKRFSRKGPISDFPQVPKELQTRAIELTKPGPLRPNPRTRELPTVFRQRRDAEVKVRSSMFDSPEELAAQGKLGTQKRPQRKRMLIDTKTNQRIVLKNELPQTVYHVTGRADEILESGLLKGQAGFNAGGLGGGGLNGVSVTPTRKSAVLIKRELGRVSELAQEAPTRQQRNELMQELAEDLNRKKGVIVEESDTVRTMIEREDLFLTEDFPGSERFEELIRRYANEDIRRAPNQELIERSKKFHSVVSGPGRQSQKFIDEVNKLIDNFKDGLFRDEAQAFKEYLIQRERFNIDIDPVILGELESYRRLDPNKIDIIAIKPDGIPDSALITTGTDEFLQELRIHSDVPVESFRVVGR